jgi:ATP-dependent Clp protease adaptor protein ClpS
LRIRAASPSLAARRSDILRQGPAAAGALASTGYDALRPRWVGAPKAGMSDTDKRNGPGDGTGGGQGNGTEGPNTGVVVKARPRTRKPSMYKVLMLNDDYTPMEFVVHVLERFFSKSREEATRIMLHVHRRGVGVCGVYTYEVAEHKVTQVMDLARQNQHPLQCTIEKE